MSRIYDGISYADLQKAAKESRHIARVLREMSDWMIREFGGPIPGVKVRLRPTSFGEALRFARDVAGKLQKPLALAVGYTHATTICSFENGRANPSLPKLEAIAKELGVRFTVSSSGWTWEKEETT
jgi:DNA-binding XRE family transcriptional regulator